MGNESRNHLDQFSRVMSRHRLAVLFVILIASAVFSVGIMYIRGDVILQDMFPQGHPYLKLHERFSEVFGSGGSSVNIAIKARNGDIFTTEILEKLQKMTQEVELWEEVYRALTQSFASRSVKVVRAAGEGEITIKPIMWPDIPATKKEMENLKYSLFSDPAYCGSLVSRDGSAALLTTEFKENISYDHAFLKLQQLVKKYTDEDTSIHIIGFPVLMGWIFSLKPQMWLVFTVSIILILITLYAIFRNLMGMMAPMIVGLISTLMGLGFIGWAGINFSPLLYVLAFLVVARQISHAVQITHRYMEELMAGGNDRHIACYETMRAMIMPNVAGVTTDAAGFLVLLLTKIVLMQQVAMIMTFWMMSVAFSGVLTPIICSFMPLKKVSTDWSKDRAKMTLMDRICMAGTNFSIGKGKYILSAGIILLLVFSIWQTSRLKIGDPTPGSPLLWPNHIYNQDQELIDKTFDASSENFMLFYEGAPKSVYDPQVFTTFEAFDYHMNERLPDIYKASDSFLNLVKMVNMTLHDGDDLWCLLPHKEEELYGITGYSKNSVDIYTRLRYLDEGMERSHITLFFADHTSDNLLRIKKAAYDFFKDRPMTLENGEFKLAGGRIGLEIAVNEEMKASHMKIDIMVLLTIFLMCSLCFRSFVAGLMLTVPLIIANLLAFAYMAINGIGLSINTLPVAAVGVGVGVDFAIYLYSRCIEEYPKCNDYRETVLVAVRTSGKAVLYTGLTLILAVIPWYLLSELKFQAQMGFFLSMLLCANVLLSLTLHPLLLVMIKPRFIKRHAAKMEKFGLSEECRPAVS
jgi:uncharacterized protein